MTTVVPIHDIDLTQALERLAGAHGQSVAAALEPILRANLEHNRLAFYLQNNLNSTLDDYVQHVLALYRRWQPYLHRLQGEKSNPDWAALREKMDAWAYAYLLRRSFRRSLETWQLARDYSADAAAAVMRARFPYDTDFDPWAVVLVHNVCRKQMREALRIQGGGKLETGVDAEWLERQPDPHAEAAFDRMIVWQELQQAIRSLEAEEQQVLWMYYFEGLKPNEIAGRLGKSATAIYSLKFQALFKLRSKFASRRV